MGNQVSASSADSHAALPIELQTFKRPRDSASDVESLERLQDPDFSWDSNVWVLVLIGPPGVTRPALGRDAVCRFRAPLYPEDFWGPRYERGDGTRRPDVSWELEDRMGVPAPRPRLLSRKHVYHVYHVSEQPSHVKGNKWTRSGGSMAMPLRPRAVALVTQPGEPQLPSPVILGGLRRRVSDPRRASCQPRAPEIPTSPDISGSKDEPPLSPATSSTLSTGPPMATPESLEAQPPPPRSPLRHRSSLHETPPKAPDSTAQPYQPTTSYQLLPRMTVNIPFGSAPFGKAPVPPPQFPDFDPLDPNLFLIPPKLSPDPKPLPATRPRHLPMPATRSGRLPTTGTVWDLHNSPSGPRRLLFASH